MIKSEIDDIYKPGAEFVQASRCEQVPHLAGAAALFVYRPIAYADV